MNRKSGGPAAIVVCEPQCAGFEHARPNAALLAAVALAFPRHPLHFLAESAHLEAVRGLLGDEAPEYAEHSLAVPDMAASALVRAQGEWAVLASALQTAQRLDAGLVLFASVSLPGLWVLHLQLRVMARPPCVLAIAHGMLAGLERSAMPLPKRIFGLRQALRLPLPRGTKLIALGESIQRCIAESAPYAAGHFLPMDLPNPSAVHDPPPPALHEPPCFGYIGVANRNKGFDRFVRVARAVRERGVKARFLLAGFVPGPMPDDAADVVEGVGHSPLPREEFAARMAAMDFVLWTGEPAHYRLTASASFLDALSFVKPGIYLTNPYIAHYAGAMGDIGTLCDSEEALVETVCAAATQPDPTRYAAQCSAILAGRRRFEPDALALRLREIAAACGFD